MKAGASGRTKSSPLVAISAHQVLARSLLTAGSMQKSPPSPPRCRIHELVAVPGTVIRTLDTSAPGQMGKSGRWPRAVAARAEASLCRSTPVHDQERAELSTLRAARRSFVSIRRVVQVRLDRRLGTPQPARDLRDRQVLLLAVVSSKRRGATALDNPITHRLTLGRLLLLAQQGTVPDVLDSHPARKRKTAVRGREVCGDTRLLLKDDRSVSELRQLL